MQSLAIERFTIADHGDQNERTFWPFLSTRFPSYEVLWRRLIVPLTNRLVPQPSQSSDEWIRLRKGIPPLYEAISMAHYSVLYFFGRAVIRLATQRPEAIKYPEDMFALLQAARENLGQFREALERLARAAGITSPIFSHLVDDTNPYREICDYRNAFLHNPILGRSIREGKVHLPRWSKSGSSPLNLVKESWRAVSGLGSDDWVDFESLLERLVHQTCEALEADWQSAIQFVEMPHFQAFYSSSVNLPAIPQTLPTFWAPAVSGTMSYSNNTSFNVSATPARG